MILISRPLNKFLEVDRGVAAENVREISNKPKTRWTLNYVPIVDLAVNCGECYVLLDIIIPFIVMWYSHWYIENTEVNS